MILQALNDLYDRFEKDDEYGIPRPGYSRQKITFRVVLRPDGELFEVQDAREPTKGKPRPRQLLVPGSTKSSGSGVNPGFLWDNSGYMLGFKTEDNKPERTRKTFAAFREWHLGIEEEISAPAFSAVCRFLETWNPEFAINDPILTDAATTGFGVFQIQGDARYVHEDARVTEWWGEQQTHEVEGPWAQCLVTGREASLARLHPKIKGVMGSQGAGGTIVGFNEDAYESYGKTQSYNAPVSEEVTRRYVVALNAMLDGPMRSRHRLTLGDMTVVFWTEQQTTTEDIFAEFVSEGSAIFADSKAQDEGVRQKVELFLRALKEGRTAYGEIDDDPERTTFFLLGLSPNAGRVSVRLFNKGTLAELLDNLRRHHRDIAITPERRSDPEYLPAWRLLRQTARGSKQIPPLLSGPLLKSIVTGITYPFALYAAVIRRLHSGDWVDYSKACVIKGYLNRNLQMEVPMSLDRDRAEPAYRLGRLFAALEKTQKDALGENLNKTIGDTYYSSASATPRSVFPRLLRTYRHHLAKLEGGHRTNREKLVQQVLHPLDGFPAHFGLADQGLFAIGYYHQTRDFYTKRKDKEPKTGGNDESV